MYISSTNFKKLRAYAGEFTKFIDMKQNIKNIVKHAEVSEKAIEKYLVERCKEVGLLCLKYSNPNAVGYPDRIVLMHGCTIVWAEIKSKGKKPTKLQQIRHEELRAAGQYVRVLDSREAVDKFIDYIYPTDAAEKEGVI